MVTQHYRWDFIGLSTDTKPTPETSEKVVDGSTFYCSDTSKLYIFCKNNWYERKALGGGGGGGDEAVKLLTSADVTGKDGDDNDIIEVWKLPAGVYRYETNDNFYIVFSMIEEGGIYIQSDEYADDCLIISGGIANESESPDYTVFSSLGFQNAILDSHGLILSGNGNWTFTGTDGIEDGSEGFVPAPYTQDAGKFLCADGTWQDAGGGGVKTLTTDDYNYNYGGQGYVGLWLLNDGIYLITPTVRTIGATKYTQFNNVNISGYVSTAIINTDGYNHKVIVLVSNGAGSYNNYLGSLTIYKTDNNGEMLTTIYETITTNNIRNDLTTTSSGFVLDARQGKALKDLIDGLDSRITALGG